MATLPLSCVIASLEIPASSGVAGAGGDDHGVVTRKLADAHLVGPKTVGSTSSPNYYNL